MTAATQGGDDGEARRLLRLAVDHLGAGDAHAALRAASALCHAAPEDADAHYAYGQAWSALNEPGRAEQAFATAVRLRPGWADAWINWGVARYSQGAIADAVVGMREALLRRPGDAAASANLGAFLRLTGEAEAAEALLREAVAGTPDNAAARLNLVADLLQEERAAEALALLDGAAPPDAATARHWHLQRALALLQLGRGAEARDALLPLDALGPLPPALAALRHWRDVLLALGEGDAGEAERAAAAMEAVLAEHGAAMVPEHRIMSHYNLAKFRDGRNEPPRAFAHWTAAHRLLAVTQPFSRPAHLETIEANIALFSRARFRDGARAANDDAAPVFIVGMPRSGTTLCERILAAHPQVHGAGERLALGRTFERLGGGSGAEAVRRVAALDAATLDGAAAGYLAERRALAPGARRVVDKMPGNYLHLGLVGLMLPGARVIWCRRDPRDIGLSIFTFRFHGHHGYAHDLADLGWTIRQQQRLMGHWLEALGMETPTVLPIDLADWVEDFDTTLARVLGHCGLPFDANCARFQESGDESGDRVRTVSRVQVREPINARGLGRWRRYGDELSPLIAELEDR